MKNSIHKLPALLGVAAGASLATLASAHEYTTCDNGAIATLPSPVIQFRVTSDEFPPADPFTAALVDVIQGWSNTGSVVQYQCAFEGPGSDKNVWGNFVNEIYWTEDGGEHPGTFDWVGLCLMRMDGSECAVTETDVIFNNIQVNFTPSTLVDEVPIAAGGPGSTYSFQAVAYHELGHAQALDHTPDAYSVMGLVPHHHVNGPFAIAYPGEDAVVGSMLLYGWIPGFTDLALAPFKYITEENGYAKSGPVDVSSAGDGPGISNLGGVEQAYPGAKVHMEVTLENLGSTNHDDVQIAFYLSSDSDITTGDDFLGQTSSNVYPNQPTTIRSPELSLPEVLPVGEDVWLGAVIDPENTIAEVDEWNNRTYVKMHVNEWRPDLMAEFIAGPSEAFTGGPSLFISSSYVNVGGTLNTPTSYEIQLVPVDSPLPPQFSGTTVASIEGVAPGFHLDVVDIPDGFPVGDYYWALKVATAPGGEESTLSEDQPNFVLGDEVTVELGPTELVAADVSGPTDAGVGTGLFQGDELSVEFTVANIGSPMTNAVNYAVVLSADELIDETDPVVTWGELTAPGNYEVEGELPDLEPGTYYWGLKLTNHGYGDDEPNNDLITHELQYHGLEGLDTDLNFGVYKRR